MRSSDVLSEGACFASLLVWFPGNLFFFLQAQRRSKVEQEEEYTIEEHQEFYDIRHTAPQHRQYLSNEVCILWGSDLFGINLGRVEDHVASFGP